MELHTNAAAVIIEELQRQSKDAYQRRDHKAMRSLFDRIRYFLGRV